MEYFKKIVGWKIFFRGRILASFCDMTCFVSFFHLWFLTTRTFLRPRQIGKWVWTITNFFKWIEMSVMRISRKPIASLLWSGTLIRTLTTKETLKPNSSKSQKPMMYVFYHPSICLNVMPIGLCKKVKTFIKVFNVFVCFFQLEFLGVELFLIVIWRIGIVDFTSIFIPSNLNVLPIGLWKQADGFIKVSIFFLCFLTIWSFGCPILQFFK